MGDNLPPGVSVSDLPGYRDPPVEEAPVCLLCEESGESYWTVKLTHYEDTEMTEAECANHGRLKPEQWQMRQI